MPSRDVLIVANINNFFAELCHVPMVSTAKDHELCCPQDEEALVAKKIIYIYIFTRLRIVFVQSVVSCSCNICETEC